MDDYCRMLVEYVAIIAAPLLGSQLGSLTLVVFAVGLAVAVIVALFVSWPSPSSAVSAAALATARFESPGGRLPRGRARARAPSAAAVHRT